MMIDHQPPVPPQPNEADRAQRPRHGSPAFERARLLTLWPKGPKNHLVFAILSTVFGFTVLGFVSIMFATQVDTRWDADEHESARRASRQARQFARLAFGVQAALVTVLLMIAFSA